MNLTQQDYLQSNPMAFPKIKTAIFVDTENMNGWIKSGGLEEIIKDLPVHQIFVRRAYADWSLASVSAHQGIISQNGFDCVHCVHPRIIKNSSDIQMSIDIIECAYLMPDISCFIIATGDSDFSPVFRKLRLLGKEVIGVCQDKSPLIAHIKSSCSRIIPVKHQSKPSPNSNTTVVAPQFGQPKKPESATTITPPATTPVAVAVAVTNTETTNKTKKQKPSEPKLSSLMESYFSVLKAQNFRLIDVNKMKIIYKHSISDSFASVPEMEESVFLKLFEKHPLILRKDITKAFNFISGMNLIQVSKNKGGQDCLAVKKMTANEFLIALDQFIISLLLQSKYQYNIEIRADEIKKILNSSMSMSAIRDFIDLEDFRLEYNSAIGNTDSISPIVQ